MTKGQKMYFGVVSCKLAAFMAVVSLFLVSSIATAQVDYIMPPMYSPLDKNGVNLATGKFQKSSTLLSLGNPAFSGIAVTEQWYGNDFSGGTISLTNYLQALFVPDTGFIYGWNVVYDGRLYTFSYTGYSYRDDGASLSRDSANNLWTMTTSDGTVVQFSNRADLAEPGNTSFSSIAVATQITEATGRTTRFVYKWENPVSNFWLVSATNNLGYQIRVIDTSFPQGSTYRYRIGALKGINDSVEYCDRSALTCPSLSNTWPTVSYAYQTEGNNILKLVTVTYASGAITSYRFTPDANHNLFAIKTLASAAENISIGYGGERVTSYSDGVSSYTYDFDLTSDAGVWTLHGTITGPGGYHHTTTADYNWDFLLTDQDALGRTTSYTRDNQNRVTKIIRPEGNSESWVYDGRGNVTEYRVVAKAGSGLEDIVLTAGYDATCSVATKNTCNKPNWIRDAKGNQTDFTYAPEHGGVLTETRPPDASGVRPQTRYAYVQGNAWVKNSSGGFVKETPVYLLSSVKTCRTSATVNGACAGTSDEVVTSYEYQVGNATKGSNLLQTGVVVTADGQTRRTCFGYDKYGNKISETKPMANLGSCP